MSQETAVNETRRGAQALQDRRGRGRPADPAKAALVQRTYRFPPELVVELDRYADEKDMPKQEAMTHLLRIALKRVESLERYERDKRPALKGRAREGGPTGQE